MTHNRRLSRRCFLAFSSSLCAIGSAASPVFLAQRAWAQTLSTPLADDNPIEAMIAKMRQQKGPPLDESLVKELVYWAHSDLEKVKAVIGREPRIVNCALDWGGGDHETALGAASHMGRRDIALFLLDHNARLDIFAATMLGKLDVVQAALSAWPHLLQTPGPHGISLIKHAQAGGQEAQAVLEYLQGLNAKAQESRATTMMHG